METIKHTIREALQGVEDLGRDPAIGARPDFQAARAVLGQLSERLGREIKAQGVPETVDELKQAVDPLVRLLAGSPELARGRPDLVRSLARLHRHVYGVTWSLEIPIRRLFGALPLRRVLPQDVHSLLDYRNALAAGLAGALSRSRPARAAGLALALAAGPVAALTDYRLSLRKWVPIEAHEVFDYAWGLTAVIAPFALGYRRKARLATVVHVALGATTVLAALFTDYRAARGVPRVGGPPEPSHPGVGNART